jgi:hypothetical protein
MLHHKINEIRLQEVVLDDIDDEPGPFCMSFGFDLEPLISSIETVGLINPPILKNEQGQIAIVAGYRRIKALKSLNAVSTACRLISGHDVPPLQCLLLNLHDNLSTRRLNDVEKGMVLNRLAAWVPEQEIVTQYMPLLGLQPHEKSLLFFLEMERDFDVKIKTFVAEGRLSWRAVKMLSDMDAASKAGLLNVISELKFNINQQLQLVDYLFDLSFIEKKSIPRILGELGLDSIHSDKNTNRPQQAKAVLNRLRTRRNPSIVKAEKRFTRAIIDLNLPDGILISAPPFFEGEHYRLEILFRKGEDLKTRLEDLIQIEGLSKLRNPWNETS